MKIIILSFILSINLNAGEYITKSPQIANRFLIENILVEVFDPAVKKYTQKYIIPSVSALGGPCDLYEQIREDKTEVLDLYSSCFGNKSNHKIDISTNSNSMRSGLIYKTCKSIVDDTDIMKSFYKKYKINRYRFNDRSLQKIHNSFFPNKEITKAQESIFTKIFYKSSKNKWKNIILSYCISPEWQIL
ncbi:hypothetical protein [Halobacteriovorax sp.]|uniref:hypothetical protein n=1 Tax=Halobacteriovorax sp. TaxID=2020862 RepID=UPI003564BC96